jgi:huntingtin-interacting protein 1-related protein
LEKLKRELRFAKEKADELERTKASELSSMLAKYNREMADLEEALHVHYQLLNITDFPDENQSFGRCFT